ncbi:SPOR domain-containing protein [Bacillus sp. V59.32b]|uniref:SPOR domain-containing protein n=1 Tax=Bacillus sp. V59.32b TaxID=1758642 RepID=UPI001358DEC3|nr:SPOR domain-containing protein [Bacillus sp. V59.32b]
MDKSGNRKSITIKINGQEKTFEENKKDRLNPENQLAATREKAEEESFDWILADHDDEKRNEIINPVPLKKSKALIDFSGNTKNRLSLIAILSAILLGTCFGVIILKTITTDDGTTATEKAPASLAPKETQSAESVNTNLKTYMVQGGVFSTESSARALQKNIKQKGVPAEIFALDGKYYIFVGTAGSLEESKGLASYHKQNQVDAFWKEVSFSTAIKGGEKERELLNEMSTLYGTLSQFTSGLLNGSVSTWDQEVLNKQVKAVNNSSENVSAEALVTMKKNISSAAELLNKYKSSKDPEQLVLAQEQLLLYLKGYQSIGGN